MARCRALPAHLRARTRSYPRTRHGDRRDRLLVDGALVQPLQLTLGRFGETDRREAHRGSLQRDLGGVVAPAHHLETRYGKEILDRWRDRRVPIDQLRPDCVDRLVRRRRRERPIRLEPQPLERPLGGYRKWA